MLSNVLMAIHQAYAFPGVIFDISEWRSSLTWTYGCRNLDLPCLRRYAVMMRRYDILRLPSSTGNPHAESSAFVVSELKAVSGAKTVSFKKPENGRFPVLRAFELWTFG
jgi:hypothetical protein